MPSSQKKKMVSHHQNSPFLLDALICEEEHWDTEGTAENCSVEGAEDEALLGDSHLFSDSDEDLRSLLKKEQETELYSSGVEENPCWGVARDEAVEWVLRVIAYYSFSALTAVLAVNYLDRFLYGFGSHREKPWMTQLAAVACLSLAAKVDETQVPLLLDLQVEETKYVFESKTIQRMEMLVLTTLEWKMNPVTPLSFLDYIVRRLPLKPHLCREFLARSHTLILSLISDCRSMSHLPSALATATMLYVIASIEPCIALKCQDQLAAILGINKEKVHDCCVLIEEMATSVKFKRMSKRKHGSLCCTSPKGVFEIEASFSSDSSNDSWPLSSSPNPLSKKLKLPTTPFSHF